jgi:hypothetical protein
MHLIYKLPNWLRWLLLPIASILSWLLVNFIGKIATKILVFLSGPTGLSENFFEYFLNPGISGYCAIQVAMAFAPKHKKNVGYTAAFLWVVLFGVVLVFNTMLKEWPSVLSSITTIAGCAIAMYGPIPEEEKL